MPEAAEIWYSLEELTKTLVKDAGKNKGHWGLTVQFGLAASNVKGEFQGDLQLRPAAIIPMLRLGIKQFLEPNEMTIDASKIGKVTKKKPTTKRVAGKRKSVAKKKR